MFFPRISLALALLVLLAGPVLQAQLPTDKVVWQDRCKLMIANDKQIRTGTVPPVLAAATRGVSGEQFVTFGWDRFRAGQHNVACTLFYMGLIADRAGNGGKVPPAITTNVGILAQDEAKVVRAQKLTMRERMKRSEIKMHQARVPALTSAQLEAVIAAASTTPISLSPPPDALR